MSFVVKDRVKETTTTTGTGTLTLAGAVSGFQAFSVVGNGNLCKYTLLASSESAPTAWERGYGTWATGGTLARTLVLDNSSGTTSAITLPAGTHTVILGWGADDARDTEVALHSMLPGGRLTLTSGTPVTTSDVTGATSIYYTPYVSNVITLWDGYRWHPIEFSEYTLALGTLTSGKPYDVFAYLSSGALALESLAWTNDTTRATAITIQDGRYCKSGDKTRLYLGTFYTTSTTTTEDSAAKRFLWNAYNRNARTLFVTDATASWTYNPAGYTIRQARGQSSNQVEAVVGISLDKVWLSANFWAVKSSATTGASYLGIGKNSTSVCTSTGQATTSNTTLVALVCNFAEIPSAGRTYYAWLEGQDGGSTTGTFYSGSESGLTGGVFA